MRRFALAWTLALAALPAVAEITGWGTELASRPAMPFIIVPPDYPAEALAKGLSAAVDVKGMVSKSGAFQRATYTASVDDPAFQKEIEKVLHYWVFIAPMNGDECERKEGESLLRVWFEIAEGKPKVSISSPPKTWGKATDGGMVTPTYREKLVYPARAMRLNIQGGRVIALSKVGADGRVQKVTLQDTGAHKSFYDETTSALMQWTYDVSTEALKDRSHVCVEHTVAFKLQK